MLDNRTLNRPIRAGVFDDIAGASAAVAGLLDAGFTVDQISVVCSDEAKEQHFREFEHQDVHYTLPLKSAAAGGATGVLAAGLGVALSAVSTGQLVFWMAGPIAALAGGVVGTLVGAMMSRGVEKELANFYEQAVADGKILVAAEDLGPQGRQKLAVASQILESVGAESLPLAEG